MKRTILLALIAAVFIFAALSANAAGEIPKAKAVAPDAAPAKSVEKTKDQMLSELREDIADNGELFEMIPELKSASDKDGNAVYTYNGALLEDLSKDDIAKLTGRVGQILARVRAERIQKQLETIKQAERIQAITTPPQLPRVPSAASQAPKIPSVPPQPPQRR